MDSGSCGSPAAARAVRCGAGRAIPRGRAGCAGGATGSAALGRSGPKPAVAREGRVAAAAAGAALRRGGGIWPGCLVFWMPAAIWVF